MSGPFEHNDKHTLGSKPADNADSAVTRVRRIERWPAEDKARMVVESLNPIRPETGNRRTALMCVVKCRRRK